MTRAHTPSRRLRDITPGRYIRTKSVSKGYAVFFGKTSGDYGLIWKGEGDFHAGKPWMDMVSLGIEASEVTP